MKKLTKRELNKIFTKLKKLGITQYQVINKEVFCELPTSSILEPTTALRKVDPRQIALLKESIISQGLILPLNVTPEKGNFVLYNGASRLQALRELKKEFCKVCIGKYNTLSTIVSNTLKVTL